MSPKEIVGFFFIIAGIATGLTWIFFLCSDDFYSDLFIYSFGFFAVASIVLGALIINKTH